MGTQQGKLRQKRYAIGHCTQLSFGSDFSLWVRVFVDLLFRDQNVFFNTDVFRASQRRLRFQTG